MKVHYYLGWFEERFPDELVKGLEEDLTDRASLVMISAMPRRVGDKDVGKTERSWLDQASLVFEKIDLLDYGLEKDHAKDLIKKASVIFLLGGHPIEQRKFLVDYGLVDLIRKSEAVVMGTSAGAINMSAKWLKSKFTGSSDRVPEIVEGIGLDEFSVLSHHDLENHLEDIQRVFSPLSNQMNIFASNRDCALRVKEGQIKILGKVYLLSRQRVHLLAETF